MTPEQARQAVDDGARVASRYAMHPPMLRAVGTITGYSEVPMIRVTKDDGTSEWWRHDLVDLMHDTPVSEGQFTAAWQAAWSEEASAFVGTSHGRTPDDDSLADPDAQATVEIGEESA